VIDDAAAARCAGRDPKRVRPPRRGPRFYYTWNAMPSFFGTGVFFSRA
jgi:hypothetical protein